MVEPMRHRQTKEAGTDMFEPKATAPHLDSTATTDTGDTKSPGSQPPKGGRASFSPRQSTGPRLDRPRVRSDLCRDFYTVGTVPPSMTYSVPVIDAARGEARNVTRSATSLGFAGRPRGMPPSESIRPFRPPS